MAYIYIYLLIGKRHMGRGQHVREEEGKMDSQSNTQKHSN